MVVGVGLLAWNVVGRARSGPNDTPSQAGDPYDGLDLEWRQGGIEIYTKASDINRIAYIDDNKQRHVYEWPGHPAWLFGVYRSHLELVVFSSGSGTAQYAIWMTAYQITDTGLVCVMVDKLVSNESSGVLFDERTGQSYVGYLNQHAPMYLREYRLTVGELETTERNVVLEEEQSMSNGPPQVLQAPATNRATGIWHLAFVHHPPSPMLR